MTLRRSSAEQPPPPAGTPSPPPRATVASGGPSVARTQAADFGGAKGKAEDTARRSVSAAANGVRGGGDEVPGSHRRMTLALATLLATACALLLTAAPAFARELHVFSTSFGEAGSANGQLALTDQSYVAVNQATGDVYVADTGNARVEEFEADGAFLRTFGTFADPTFIAVDNSTGPSKGDVYAADSGDNTVSKFEADGALIPSWGTSGQLSGFAQLAGIAVDPSGNLWVYDHNSQMREYAPDGTLTTDWESPYRVTDSGIAVDSFDDLYVVREEPPVAKLRPTGAAITESVDPGPVAGLAVDPSNDDLYVAHPTEILGYSAAGERLESFGPPELGVAAGLAVGSAHALYVADTAKQRIDVFTQVPGVPLAVATSGSGSGTVISKPAGIECGSTCAAEFGERSTVTLTATPTKRSTFTGWTGCTAVHGDECEVEMTGAEEVKAEFAAIPQEKLTVPQPGEGIGGGRVSGKSPGSEFTSIECGNGATACEAEYNKEVTITLTATPTERSTFTGWTGCTAVHGDECEVEMTEAKSVKAEFATIPQQTLTVATEGPGAGIVTGTSPGIEFKSIDCGNGATTCAENYNPGATITLTAVPAAAYQFTGWSGGGCSGKGTCKVELNADTKVSANFISKPPSISNFSASNLTATTAELHAEIDPNGADTTYHFEYGTTTNYGASKPSPAEDIGSGLAVRNVTETLTGLQEHVVYHFRVVGENDEGEKTTTEDQSFTFFPPSCPNEHVRQQTGANYLPDCRAYELVSPPSQGNLTPFPAEGPATGYATEPSRLAYVGAFGDVPGIGEPSNSIGDMYVATRTSEGWTTKFVGLPGDKTFLMGSPPWTVSNQIYDPAQWQMGVIADPSLSRIVDWSDGYPSGEFVGDCPCIGSSNAPYVWESTTGDVIGRFPTNLATVSEGENFYGPTFASRDLSHFVFSSNIAFVEGGEPGDTYDNNTVTGATVDLSREPGGADKQGGTVKVSSEGSHILMATAGQLYIRVGDAATIEIAPGHALNYVGMTADGSKVFFTSEEHLTHEDEDHGGASLFMWSEQGEKEGHPLTLISKGDNPGEAGEPGNTSSCNASWTSQCGVSLISFSPYSHLLGGLGGNCGYVPTCEPSDSFIASGNGDIYFYSPEQLDGSKGTPESAESLRLPQ